MRQLEAAALMNLKALLTDLPSFPVILILLVPLSQSLDKLLTNNSLIRIDPPHQTLNECRS